MPSHSAASMVLFLLHFANAQLHGKPHAPSYDPHSSDHAASTASPGPSCCRRGQACWPSAADIEAFSSALNPELSRNLHWNGSRYPRPAPVPAYSPGQQPLFGMNQNLRPVYVQNKTDDQAAACPVPYASELCMAATRNWPLEGWEPAFVAWPLTAAHVQTALRFAKRHSLCVAVAGTGHDFLNRHSTSDGLLIRTTLLKDIDWAPPDHAANSAVKLGAGLNFQEVDWSLSLHAPGRFVATGWGGTVGVAGWSIGGGHGPFSASKGLGVDNLLEVEIVLANGSLATASKDNNEDLFWALRGGGGSTWGVITALTLRTHAMPPSGVVQWTLVLAGTMCNAGEGQLNQTVDAYLDWTPGLDERWSGLALWEPAPANGSACPTWELVIEYIYLGSSEEPEFQLQTTRLTKAMAGIYVFADINVTFANWWQRNLPTQKEGQTDAINTFKMDFKKLGNGIGGIPSVLLNDTSIRSKKLREKSKAAMLLCKHLAPEQHCTGLQYYHDIPGTRTSSDFPANSTSISAGFRTANLHLEITTFDASLANSFYEFGSHSYFSESAYYMPGDSWKQRYWGHNYDRLLAIKNRYDPDHLFWCHHCVGSDTKGSEVTAVIV